VRGKWDNNGRSVISAERIYTLWVGNLVLFFVCGKTIDFSLTLEMTGITARRPEYFYDVIPAYAGIQEFAERRHWIPDLRYAPSGMTGGVRSGR
jgi:hypothetical protein